MNSDPHPTRRDFLTGQAVRSHIQAAAQRAAADGDSTDVPSRGPTLLLRTVAMACDFDVMLNPNGDGGQLEAASLALDLVHELEQMMTVYRDDARLSVVNRSAADGPVEIERELYELLQRAQRISEETWGAFDAASGAIVSLWRRCRQAGTIPSDAEVQAALARSGSAHVRLINEQSSGECDEGHSGHRESGGGHSGASWPTVEFLRPGIELNLGAIGKGYAVDRAGRVLLERGVDDWLVHGGRSSLLARGRHASLDGWPVGLRNPLLPDKPFATILLRDEALGTSGTAVQWFRHEGKRYGHILDPRTGWPIESMLSVSVIAPDAALADALSTAFFVLGVENALKCCDNFPMVGAIFFPPPRQGQSLDPIFHNIPADRVFFED